MKINENILLQLCNAAITAGNRVLDFYELDTEIIYKEDESPLTKADLDSNKILLSSISKITPNVPILSEEEFIEWDTRKNWETYWLIDPLDGTKEFIKKNDEFTINIALIEYNQPVLGIIYAPAFGSLFFSKKNNGSYKIYTKNNLNTFKNSEKISVKYTNNEKIRVIGSRSHSNIAFDNWVKKKFTNFFIML